MKKLIFSLLTVFACTTAFATPLVFTENKGQVTDQYYKPRMDIQYQVCAGNGLNLFIGAGALHYQFCKPIDAVATTGTTDYSMYRMDVELVGSNKQPKVIAEQKQADCLHYYTTGTGEQGALVYSYGKIIYKEIYPNIDWVLSVANGQVKHEFVVRPGGNVADIKLKYSGATDIRLTEKGELVATTPQGTIKEMAPYTYQQDGKMVSSSFKLNGDILTYTTGTYTGTLIVDPSIDWATYYGGNISDNAYYVAEDASGNVYMGGRASSTSSIATSGAWQTTYAGGNDAFLVKFTSAGARVWATYYGGPGNDAADGVAVDAAGNIFIGGATSSISVIATTGAWQTVYGGGNWDAYLAKFDATGARLWGTYLGGSNEDIGPTGCIATDAAGNAYLCGRTGSGSGIASAGAWQTVKGDSTDAFVAKFNTSGTRLWGTYIGADSIDQASSVATDLTGNVYVSGYTNSLSGIASAGAWQSAIGGGDDGFVVKFDASGARLWGTYYGGAGDDYGNAVATDRTGNLYIGGVAMSTSGIVSAGCYQPVMSGTIDAYLAKFNSSGTRLWGTYFGGPSGESIVSISADTFGNVCVTGSTGSTSGIATTGAHQTIHGGSFDAFLSKFSGAGNLLWSTYLGGNMGELSHAVVTDGKNIYFAGETSSFAGITTPLSFQPGYGSGTMNGFLAKFIDSTPVTTGSFLMDGSKGFHIYPNPAKDRLIIQWSGVYTTHIQVVITDVAGRVAGKGYIEASDNWGKTDWNISDLEDGIYVISLSADGAMHTSKIVVQNSRK